jgi:transcriptional antiterminator
MLPEQAIDEYIQIYRKKFGITLSKQEASFRANHLVNLYKAVLGPESSGEVKKVEKFGDHQSHDEDQ